jgi:DNA polymerase-3 subunit epsilon
MPLHIYFAFDNTSVIVLLGVATMNFMAIDVETANSDLSSICQIGIASFCNGVLHDVWGSLVNPEAFFDPINVSIHGIDKRDVRSSPNWKAIYSKVSTLLQGSVAVSHTAFDRIALLRACEKAKLASCDCQWLDSARVVRRAWPKFSHSGYGLSNVAAEFGIEYRQHDALEDARCAGEILLRAISETGLGIKEWLERVKQPINLSSMLPIIRDANPDGPLYGEILVFTGALSMSRGEAADAASRAGCEVDASVTKRTTLLVLGDQDLRKLAGYEKSSKQRKVEELISMGHRIRVISEGDFLRVVGLPVSKHENPIRRQ